MKTDALIFSAVTFLGVLIFYLLFLHRPAHTRRSRALSLFFKGAPTAFAALLSLYGIAMTPTPGNILLAAGLIICVAADVVLDVKFMPGMALFGLGHIGYCAACLYQAPPTILSLGIFLVLSGICAWVYPRLKKTAAGQNLLPFLCYGFLLFLMLSLAAVQKPVLRIGATLFVISDCLLAYGIFSKKRSHGMDYWCLGCYYLAQYLIALSILLN